MVNKKGFLVMEALLAAAVFVVMATGMIIAVIGAWNANRLGEEEMVAAEYATEGLEAVRSIKNRGFANLVNTSGTGISQSGGAWVFSGSNNTDVTGRYVRLISIAAVNQDTSGNIVPAPSGTVDNNRKKVTATVNWNFTGTQPKTVALTNYLTNWKSNRGGVVVYGDGTTTPKFRNYDIGANVFDGEKNGVAGVGNPRTWAIKTSPTKSEAVAGFVDGSGILRIMCFDGVNWTSEWSVTVGGTGTTKRFGIAYENSSGKVMVVYANSAGGNNGLSYRTRPDSSGCGSAGWSGASSLPTSPVLTTGTVQWVRLEANPTGGSNQLVAVWNDANSRLGAAVWNGNAWGNLPAAPLETALEYAAAAGDVQSFDVAIESISGNAMVVWGVSDAGGRCSAACMEYARFTGSSWSAAAAIPTVADSATNIDLSANPNTNDLITAGIDNGPNSNNLDDLSMAFWSGSAWTGRANQDTSTAHPLAGTKLVSTGWLISGSTTRSVVVYNDSSSTALGWYVCNVTTCTKQTDWIPTPGFGSPRKWLDVFMDPANKDRLIEMIVDVNNDLFGKRLWMSPTGTFTSSYGWTNADGGVALETALGQAIASPFGFAYWREP